MLGERAQRSPRMRVRVRSSWFPPGQARWEEDPEFSADDHVHTHHLPSPGDRGQLGELVSELLAEPLDLTRPLWELHLIAGLDGGRFAVLVKLHHALADGATAVELGLGLLDGFEAMPQKPRRSPPKREAFDLAQVASGLLRRPEETFRQALNAAGDLRHVAQQTGEALDIVSSMLRNARLPIPTSPLSARPSSARRVELLPLDLRDLRRIRKRHGGTTNDVLLAVVTGALRRWLSTRGHPVDELNLRALVPVSHLQGQAGEAGNRLSGYLCDLPVSEPDPAKRLQAIRASMDRNKASGPLRGPGAFPLLADRVPSAVHRVATPVAGLGAGLLFDTVITNVPLPDMPVALDGCGLQELYPVVPLAAGHALSIAASQYRGTVHIGLQANRAALPDIEKLNESLSTAVDELNAPEP
jgi:diacylglycerol O-acyltransferase / wax synthase